MILLTTFTTIGFVITFIGLCWITDKYSEILADYKRRLCFLENQNKELREVYKNALQSNQRSNKENTKDN